jgi:hypothetical protein
MNVEGDWNLNVLFCFMETTQEQLHLNEVWYSGTVKHHGHTYIWITVLFDGT